MSDTDERGFAETIDGRECTHCGEWKVESQFEDGSLVCRACGEGFAGPMDDEEEQ
jgi:transcription initiation factor TFIIIB Brf1 subunit/transcription initiation factor TFIIB